MKPHTYHKVADCVEVKWGYYHAPNFIEIYKFGDFTYRIGWGMWDADVTEEQAARWQGDTMMERMHQYQRDMDEDRVSFSCVEEVAYFTKANFDLEISVLIIEELFRQ